MCHRVFGISSQLDFVFADRRFGVAVIAQRSGKPCVNLWKIGIGGGDLGIDLASFGKAVWLVQNYSHDESKFVSSYAARKGLSKRLDGRVDLFSFNLTARAAQPL